MTKKELIELVAANNRLTNKKAKEVVASVFANIIRTVVKNEKVVITGFGTFGLSLRKARKGRNPKTGESIMIPAHKSLVFRAGKKSKKAMTK